MQRFQQAERSLEYVMAGFAMPEPFFSLSLEEALSSFLSALTDPALPLMEMQVGSIWSALHSICLMLCVCVCCAGSHVGHFQSHLTVSRERDSDMPQSLCQQPHLCILPVPQSPGTH